MRNLTSMSLRTSQPSAYQSSDSVSASPLPSREACAPQNVPVSRQAHIRLQGLLCATKGQALRIGVSAQRTSRIAGSILMSVRTAVEEASLRAVSSSAPVQGPGRVQCNASGVL